MLEAADHAYAPSNGSKELYELAGKGGCRIMRQPYQRGLLQAVRQSIGTGHSGTDGLGLLYGSTEDSSDLLRFLLEAAELPRFRQVLRTIRWSLEP